MKSGASQRELIHAALADGNTNRAFGLTKQLWFAEPTLPNAPFVLQQLNQLPQSPPPVACKLFILRSFSVEPLIPLLRATAACWGIDLSVEIGQFNSYVQEMLDPQSALYTVPPDVLLLAVQTRDLLPEIWSRSAELENSDLERLIERVSNDFRSWINAVRSRCSSSIVIHNLEIPADLAMGVFDTQNLQGQQRAIERINTRLIELATEFTGVYVLNYEALIARHGRLHWADEKKWLMARFPLSADSMRYLVDEWMKYLVSLMGRQAKCLVCDLDNTLWGGIIGEDGLEGIKVGREYPGAAYLDLQRAILDLSRRGILLAICSKNNPDDAFQALEEHPEMLLRKKDFAAHRINWRDKPTNLREIAAELNIGLDSLVLIDDNPVERDLVRELLPEVDVINIDAEQPFSHAAALRQCPRFERLKISEEDRQRNQLYAQEKERVSLASSAATVEDYLRSLEMIAEFGRANSTTRQRIAQLTQKTNQLNMTTRRYSEQEIQEWMANPHARVYWVRVKDRFGDNGIIGVMIVQERKSSWEIDTFLMSCRVIGRTVETAMLSFLVNQAIEAGIGRLVGTFLPSAKNAPAKEIYATHGFVCVNTNRDGSLWEIDTASPPFTNPEWIESRFLS